MTSRLTQTISYSTPDDTKTCRDFDTKIAAGPGSGIDVHDKAKLHLVALQQYIYDTVDLHDKCFGNEMDPLRLSSRTLIWVSTHAHRAQFPSRSGPVNVNMVYANCTALPYEGVKG